MIACPSLRLERLTRVDVTCCRFDLLCSATPTHCAQRHRRTVLSDTNALCSATPTHCDVHLVVPARADAHFSAVAEPASEWNERVPLPVGRKGRTRERTGGS